MDEQLQKYWDDALPIMEKSFTEVVYSTWIKTLIPVGIEDNVLSLKTPQGFFKNTINKRYLFDIKNTLNTVSGQDFDIKIVSQEDFEIDKAAISPSLAISNTGIRNSIQSKYVFETFVRGKSNELAYAAAMAVSDAPGETSYNPLFIYGGVGLGKTHLMHSIGNYILDKNPDRKVLYVSTETFTNELITSIRERRNQEFRNKYREIDVLLIDDIQFLSEKEGTQEEFFHTFNSLYDLHKQIVISSDQPPRDIKTLEDRLRSRFGCGLIVDITLPDFETRTAILEKKAELDHINIPKEVIKLLAKNIVSNIRDLEGALNKVMAYAKLTNRKIDFEIADKALFDMVREREKEKITADYIIEIVALNYKLTIDDLTSKKRSQNIVYPRQIAMYLCRKILDMPLLKIGGKFGGRDHSTVIHACEKIAEEIESNEELRKELAALEKRIKGE